MAKAKARRRVRDTWKEKSWYTIKTPVNFEDKEIGETPARDPDLLIGRGVEVTMRELTGDFSKQYIKLRFEIDNVAGEVANTKFTGHKTTTDYVRSMIRRGTSRIDASAVVTTKDDRMRIRQFIRFEHSGHIINQRRVMINESRNMVSPQFLGYFGLLIVANPKVDDITCRSMV